MAVIEDVNTSNQIVIDGKSYDVVREEVIEEGKLTKLVIEEGSSEDSPNEADMCTMHYTGVLASNDKKFDSSFDRNSPFEFQVGVQQVIQGWDKGVPSMKKGELAVLKINSDWGYGSQGAGADIPPNADLNFLVKLLDFNEKEKEVWEMSESEKTLHAEKKKAEGNGFFKSGELQKAQRCYLSGLEAFNNDNMNQTIIEDDSGVKQIYVDLCNNSGLVYMKSQDWTLAAGQLSKALTADKLNEKAFNNIIICYTKMQEFYAAKKVIRTMEENFNHNENNDSSSTSQLQTKIKTAIANVTKAEKQATKDQKAFYGKMFK